MGLALLSAAISGVIFGVGLALAGMLNPAKVAGFLDIFGLWDPSLMLARKVGPPALGDRGGLSGSE